MWLVWAQISDITKVPARSECDYSHSEMWSGKNKARDNLHALSPGTRTQRFKQTYKSSTQSSSIKQRPIGGPVAVSKAYDLFIQAFKLEIM